MSAPTGTNRLRTFITSFAALLEEDPAEDTIRIRGGALLKELLSTSDWLPEEYKLPDTEYYRQYLLHADSLERFSVVSFVWGPGQSTPIHDHTVWGLIGVLQGAEYTQNFIRTPEGHLEPHGEKIRMEPGTIEAVSPAIGDLHRVSNVYDDRVSISIHVYGANIGAVKRSVYKEDGTQKLFISGYSNTSLPNIWDRSKE